MTAWLEICRKGVEFVHRQGRVCLHCGCFQSQESLFCAKCEARLWRNHSEIVRFNEPTSGIPGKALFSWYPDQDRMVSKLLLSLKGGRLRSALKYYAVQFCSKIEVEGRLKEAVLVPCPSSQNEDHASVLADQFGAILNRPVRRVLKRVRTQTPQKSLSRSDRLKLEMIAMEKVVNQHVIFIDDILTTGGTAAAAMNALGLKGSFEVWCLGRRYERMDV